MSAVLSRLPQLPSLRRGPHGRIRCELDSWDFDPVYTEGACPICGWKPELAPTAPAWVKLFRRVDWDLVYLLAFIAVLVIAGSAVLRWAGLTFRTLA